MKALNVIMTLCSIACAAGQSFAQTEVGESESNFQYGVSFKLRIEFAIIKSEIFPIVHLAINGGAAANFITEEIHPSVNAEIQVYRGGLGSALPILKRPMLNFDFITAFTLTAGYKNVFSDPYNEDRYGNVPLYYFSNFSYPALRNPYLNSISLGTNLIFTTDRRKKNQRVGFLNIHTGPVQVSYYNDGAAPFLQTHLADGEDRFYTGGGLISYHGKSYTVCNLIEVAYNKYTGFSRDAFEISNEMDLAYVTYHDERQHYFNKSQLSVTVASPSDHWGGSVILNNFPELDAQHWIHWFLYDSYHISPYRSFVSIVPVGYYTYTKVGLK